MPIVRNQIPQSQVTIVPRHQSYLHEPATGLHFADVEKLIGVLNRLVNTGNTVLVIEHNLDVIKTADWLIDMGPEGGYVVAEGTLEGRPKSRHDNRCQLVNGLRYLYKALSLFSKQIWPGKIAEFGEKPTFRPRF